MDSDKIKLMPNDLPDNLNFIPENAHQKASGGQQIFRFMLTRGKTLIIITEAIVLLVFLSRFKLDRQINDLSENLENKAAIIKSSQNLEKEHYRVQNKLKILQDTINLQTDWKDIISNFDSQIPSELSLRSVSYTPNSLSFKAEVSNALPFAFFIDTLSKNPRIESVVLESSRYITDTKTYDFSMKIDLKNEP